MSPPTDAASPPFAAASSPRAALVIAHPGHELRVHGWLEREKPVVFVLTDGSGHTGQGRLASTAEVLLRAGARPGAIFGALADRRLYRALLDRETELFAGLADDLAAALEGEEIEIVLGDAAEGFNPGHDVCRLLLNAAVARLAARGRSLRSYEFPLEAAPNLETPGSLRLVLDDAALERKLAASHGYPEMRYEVEKALASHGTAAFRSEILTPVEYGFDLAGRFPHPPYYESYGEGQVAKGIYTEVLRFREHFEPLALALERRAGAPAA